MTSSLGHSEARESFVMSDLSEALRRWPLWTALAWEDIRQRYRRTVFGALWAAIAFALFCGVKIAVFGASSGAEQGFFAAYVILGFWVWQLISAVVTDGCSTFINVQSWIKGARLPLSLFVLQSITRLAILSGFSLLAAIPLLLFVGQPVGPVAFASLPALLAYVLAAIPVQLLLGTLCSLFRDLQQIMSTVMRVLFFATPIIWLPGRVGRIGEFAKYNPFTHYIEIFRSPIAYGQIPWTSWAVVCVLTAAVWMVAILVFHRYGRRIAYWV